MKSQTFKATTKKPLRYKDERYEAATGKNWEGWLMALKKVGAEKMTHKEIALLLQNKFKVSPWWSQSITVRFEQEIGRRVPGETSNNTFQANISKTVNGVMEDLFLKWVGHYSNITSLNGTKLKAEPATSETAKWRYWRVKLADGSAITVNFSQKEKSKVLILVNHDNLLNEEETTNWKNFWKKELTLFTTT